MPYYRKGWHDLHTLPSVNLTPPQRALKVLGQETSRGLALSRMSLHESGRCHALKIAYGFHDLPQAVCSYDPQTKSCRYSSQVSTAISVRVTRGGALQDEISKYVLAKSYSHHLLRPYCMPDI